MERTEYAILGVVALATVGIGVFTTNRPLGQFLIENTRQFLTTTATMAWITWWALVVGFAIAGGVEAWTSNEQVADLLDGHGPREIGTVRSSGSSPRRVPTRRSRPRRTS